MVCLWNEVNHAVIITNSVVDVIFSFVAKFITRTCSLYGKYSLESVEASKP